MIREFRHTEIGSTNDEARRLLELGEPPPFVVRADRQTAGRGRGDRLWWSDSGSLTFTIVLDPAAIPLPESLLPRVSMAVAVAIIDALEAVAAVPRGTLGIRWPNDVETADRKLAGILPELIQVENGLRLVLGIGLNLTTDLALAPPEIQAMATSVQAITTMPVDPQAVYRAVLDLVTSHTIALVNADPSLPRRWAALDTLKNRTVRARRGGVITTGRVIGINSEGWLVLRDLANGRVLSLTGGEIPRDPPPG